MTKLIAPYATTTLPMNDVPSTVGATASSRNVWNGTREPIAAMKSIPLTRSGRPPNCGAVSTVGSRVSCVSCPRQCQ